MLSLLGDSEVRRGFGGIVVDYLIATARTIRRLDNGDVRRSDGETFDVRRFDIETPSDERLETRDAPLALTRNP